jgi:hypothetical protein
VVAPVASSYSVSAGQPIYAGRLRSGFVAGAVLAALAAGGTLALQGAFGAGAGLTPTRAGGTLVVADFIRPPADGVSNLAAFIGDSNVEHPFKATPLYWMLGLVGAPLEVLANSGKSGVTIQGLVSQIDELYTNGANPGLDGLPPLGWIFIQAGTNGLRDITSMPGDQAGYIEDLNNKAKALAEHVVWVTMPPAGGVSTTKQRGYPVFREYMQGFVTADTSGRTHLLDPWGTTIDGSGNIIPEFWLVDEYHPSYAAGAVVGLEAKPQLEYLFSNQSYPRAPLVTDAADVYPSQPQWINNPTATGNVSFSGGWSGNLPTGWSIGTNGSGIGGTTAIVAADAEDPNQVPWVRITPSTSSSFAQISLTFTASGRSITSIDPSTLEQLLEVKAEGLENFNLLEFWMQNNSGNKTTSVAYLGLRASGLTAGPSVLRQKFSRSGNTAGGTPIIGVVYIYSVVADSGSMGSILVRCPSVRG